MAFRERSNTHLNVLACSPKVFSAAVDAVCTQNKFGLNGHLSKATSNFATRTTTSLSAFPPGQSIFARTLVIRQTARAAKVSIRFETLEFLFIELSDAF